MRWAIVSDVHANLEALEAVLAELERERPEALVCLGDFVGYGASPNECIARLRPRLAAAVAGNHDFAAVGRTRLSSFSGDAATAARWTGAQLTPEHRDYLLALPLSVRWRDTLLVHASPALPESWAYVLSPLDAEEELESFDEALGFIGHSHYPGAFVRDGAGAILRRLLALHLLHHLPRRRDVGRVGRCLPLARATLAEVHDAIAEAEIAARLPRRGQFAGSTRRRACCARGACPTTSTARCAASATPGCRASCPSA